MNNDRFTPIDAIEAAVESLLRCGGAVNAEAERNSVETLMDLFLLTQRQAEGFWNEGKLKVLGVPLRVALFAASPRSHSFAVGFTLRSLTQNTTLN